MKIEKIEMVSAGQDRIMEILVYLLNEIRAKDITEVDLAALSDKGFTQTEISTAFSWLFDKLATRMNQVIPESSNIAQSFELLKKEPELATTFRVFHDVERTILSIEAQGYLLQMRQLGLLSESEMELLIDRILMSGVSQVGLREIKELTAGLVFDFDDSTRIGSRLMLSAKDTIQ